MKKQRMPTIVLGTILVVVALLLSVVNMVTGPIIEAQRNAAANEALLIVYPDGESFEELDVATLGLPETVTAAYKEKSGGYVFRVTATGYKPGLMVMVGIDAEGKVVGTKCLETQDTFGKEPEIDGQYNGQSLADFTPYMISGATLTSNGYRDAVNTALQAFVLASGGKLDPSIVLEGMIAELAPGLVNPAAVDAGGNIKKALKASNDAGFAYIMADGDGTFLVLVNATGGCAVYDEEKNDVTAAHATIVAEAQAHAKANGKSYDQDLAKKLAKMMEGAADITPMTVDTFGTVVSAASFTAEGNTYYAYMARPYGFDQMDVYFILDENGAIAKMDAKEFIFEKEFFMAFGGMNDAEYKDGFVGNDINSWSEDKAVIATATMTSNAMKQATADVFAAFAAK